ncbi:PilZ domain-containing protein [Desulfococcaceae bacterium HSG8]|nr:PilZ domain-containing protein [Desulfococcaceae bacterium HSG8]
MPKKKVFIADNSTVTLTCPKCRNSKKVDISKYKDIDKAANMKYECTCGHVYNVLLERRKFYRKETCLPGVYMLSGKDISKPMLVKDLSLIGLKFEIESDADFVLDDRLCVKFSLDDEQRTLIIKEVVVKKIYEGLIGTEFSTREDDPSDKAVESYLIP